MVPTWLSTLVAGLDPPAFWLLFAALSLGAPLMLYLGSQAFWRLRTITDTPTARIASASQGYCELSGFARAHLASVEAPLTGRPCLWFRFRIEKRGGGRNKDWRTVEQGESPAPFRLDDQSGQCIIEPAGALVRVRRRDRWSGAHRHPRQPTPTRWYELSGDYRYTEERIQDGDPLYCLGRFETPLRGPAERERLTGALLRVWKHDPRRMAAFDTDGDGRVSVQEWERARGQAAAWAERAERERSTTPVLAHLRTTGDTRQPFFISTYAEAELAASLRLQAWGYSAAFVALSVLAVLSGIARFGA